MANNLFGNLLVVFIIAAIFATIYCKVTDKTLTDLAREIKEIIFMGGQDE